jgi:hypothetical protein
MAAGLYTIIKGLSMHPGNLPVLKATGLTYFSSRHMMAKREMSNCFEAVFLQARAEEATPKFDSTVPMFGSRVAKHHFAIAHYF